MARVLFDSAHNEYLRIGKWGAGNYMDVHPESMDFQELALTVARFGFELTNIDSGVFPTNLKDYCDILVIGDPEDDYFHSRPFLNKQKKCHLSNQEIDNILEFVKAGGGLLILQEKYCDTRRHNNLNDLTKHFGVTFRDELLESTNCHSGDKKWIVIEDFHEHDITNHISKIIFFEGCSMQVNSSMTNTIAVAHTNSSTRPHAKAPLVVTTSYENGRVVCMGDATIFSELGFRENNNAKNHYQFLWNILRWLTPQRNLSDNLAITDTAGILLPITLNKIAQIESQVQAISSNNARQTPTTQNGSSSDLSKILTDISQIKESIEQMNGDNRTGKFLDIVSDIVLMFSALSLVYVLGQEFAESSKIITALSCIAFTALAIVTKMFWVPKRKQKK